MKRYKENRFFIWALIIILFIQLAYLSVASTNVPLMDYWRYIDMFVEKLYTGGITFFDLWQNDGIHRSPLQFLFFVLNVQFFHMNAQVEVYLGAFLMAAIGVILYNCLKKELDCQNALIKGCSGTCILLFVFNLNQYEIINEQFSLSFAARIILFVVSYILTSKYLHNIRRLKKYTFELGMLYIFVIASVGSGFFPAYVVTIGFTILFHYALNYKEEKNTFTRQYIILYIFLVIGTVVYLYGALGETSQISQGNISVLLFVKNFIIGVLTMLGVCVIGFEFSNGITIAMGCAIAFLIIVSIYVYFKREYYKITYVPILFYGYSVGAMGLIYLGRAGRFGLDYAYSPRYVGESNFVLLAFLWIVFLYLSEKEKITTISIKGLKYVLLSGLMIISIGILSSDYKEFKIAPYRKIYGENLIQSMLQVESLESDDFAPFQAKEENVRKGIEIMKKYDLGIFYYN